jgi:polyhydroxyalkanoate synthesis regulator protein
MRSIRRYANRKLYDTQDSHYVTLAQLTAFIRAGDEIQVG